MLGLAHSFHWFKERDGRQRKKIETNEDMQGHRRNESMQ